MKPEVGAFVTFGVGAGIFLVLARVLKKQEDKQRIFALTHQPGPMQQPASSVPKLANSVQPAPQPAPAPQGPHPLTGDSLTPQDGLRYRVTVVTHFPASLAASVSEVQSQAEKHGFTNVSVQKQKPAGWPGGADGDYFVDGHYAGAPQSLARSYLGGQVQIVEVWEGG